jgi:membrane-bound lytic murein transglycosylase MltF
MRLFVVCLAAATLLTVAGDAPAQAQPASRLASQPAAAPAQPAATAGRKLDLTKLTEETFIGDFDRMLERRRIRISVPYSRTLYYNDKGRERGMTAELVRDFERWINEKYAKQLGKRPLTVYITPTTRDELIDDVVAGRADLAAGNLSVTPKRLERLDFYAPKDLAATREVLVTGATAPALGTLDDLAGKTVHVRPSSSYHESLVALNAKFKAAGRPPVKIVALPDALEDEDVMEMINAGILQTTVVDEWKARIWEQILPKVKVRGELVLRDDARIGWAYRKNSPKLAAELEDFFLNFARKQGVIAYRLKRQMQNVKQLKDPTRSAEYKRFRDTVALFHKYGPKYGFDPLMLAAQGFQESQLRQEARSHMGAVGIMQLLPATAKELKVGDISVAENNVHAGAKYMDQLMTRYFPDAKFSEADRPLFAFAAYNMGPGNLAKMRREAATRGLDENKWFNNVELVTAEKIGIETTTYVRNIFKYYAAYRLSRETVDEQMRARQSVGVKQ